MLPAHNDSETPANGQQVITACAFIHQKFDDVEKVFLAKRASTKKFLPDVFELPGGHIEYGEDVVEGLKREVSEELHMEIKVGDPFYVYTYLNKLKGSHSIEVDYFAKFISAIKDIKINPTDHSEFGWFSEEEISTKIIPANGGTDPEIKVILKGFSYLSGQALMF